MARLEREERGVVVDPDDAAAGAYVSPTADFLGLLTLFLFGLASTAVLL